jgi:hypothetical protein
MKMLLTLGGLIGALFLAPGAFAADGDSCQSHTADASIPLFNKGVWIPIACVQLCDGKAFGDAGAGACTEFDFASVPGMPELVVFEYEEDPANPDCGATPDFTFTTGPIAGGTPAYDIDSSPLILNPTTDKIIVDLSRVPMDRFLFTALGDAATCSDLDVRLFFYTRKTGLF